MTELLSDPSTPALPTRAADSRAGDGRRLDTAHVLGGSASYWFSMFAASALGTNLGDFTVAALSLGRGTSFILLAAAAALAVGSDAKSAMRSEAGFWIAIVTLRAAATNVADFLTHDLHFGYFSLTVEFGAVTLLAGNFTRIGTTRIGTMAKGTPQIDGRYWMAMLCAGVFGTLAGDYASDTLGLFPAAEVVCAMAVAVLAARNTFAARSAMAYWCVVLAERCAGTPVGDALASHRAVGLGLPLATVCTGGLLSAGLLVRWHASRRHA